ncbi:hypothetical protein BDZ91DRAFT_849522 [Kalaharituber pfeilii]|nr:hypothetical protein BDZ91DRAFT_849522 [Kalaharituber pfeilii]
MQDNLGSEERVPIKCSLTVPAIWSDKGKEMIKQAAIDAGIAEKHIYMISELEAAAVHCLTDLNETKGSLKVGDIYVIVDCGGGTVDLMSYQVTSTEPLRVNESTRGTGGLYGSTLLNREFEALVIHRIGKDAFDQMDDEDRQEMRKDFETEIKPKFDPDHDDNDDDVVTCALPGVPDNPEKRVRKRKITFTTKEVKGIFEPTFTKIAETVQKQVIAVQEASRKYVDGIILVGGFGSSKYLANWLKANVRNKDGTIMKLIRPLAPALAIVLGAVRLGVQMHLSGETPWIVLYELVHSKGGRHTPRCQLLLRLGLPLPNHRLRRSTKEQLVFEHAIYVSAEDIAPMDKEHPKASTASTKVKFRFFPSGIAWIIDRRLARGRVVTLIQKEEEFEPFEAICGAPQMAPFAGTLTSVAKGGRDFVRRLAL